VPEVGNRISDTLIVPLPEPFWVLTEPETVMGNE
jgi:hypothetical protein